MPTITEPSGISWQFVLMEKLFIKSGLCPHCKKPIYLRNPSGFCDHLYYPEKCEVCKTLRS